MSLGDIISTSIVVLIFLTAIIFYLADLKRAKVIIRDYLLERGATDVQVSPTLFDLDRDTLTFNVAYTGAKGNRQTTRCKVRHWGLSIDREIFWSNPLKLELLQGKAKLHPQREMSRSEDSE